MWSYIHGRITELVGYIIYGTHNVDHRPLKEDLNF